MEAGFVFPLKGASGRLERLEAFLRRLLFSNSLQVSLFQPFNLSSTPRQGFKPSHFSHNAALLLLLEVYAVRCGKLERVLSLQS